MTLEERLQSCFLGVVCPCPCILNGQGHGPDIGRGERGPQAPRRELLELRGQASMPRWGELQLFSRDGPTPD